MEWRFSTFLLVLLALLVGFSIAPINETMCSSEYVLGVLRDHSKDGALNCFDFWLNRYQTLVGAIVAVGAAAIAWIAVQQQVAVARKQLDLALGYADPEFIVAKDGFDTFVIRIFSQSRYPIVISSIELLMREEAIMDVRCRQRPNDFRKFGIQVREQLVLGTLQIPGSLRPGSEIVEYEIEIATTMNNPGMFPD
jgi:hypothetical protein